MLVGLIARAIDKGDAHDHHFADRAIEFAFLANGGEVSQPAFRDRRAIEQHFIEVHQRAAFADNALGNGLALGRIGLGVGNTGHGFV